MRRYAVALLPALVSLASAGAVATYEGFNVTWSDTFTGAAGDAVSSDIWNIALSINTNSELEVYTTSSRNIQISGGGTVQIVPWQSATGTWTSGRIESQATFTPAAGAITIFEASIRFGDNPTANKQGIWPAFWMLGDSVHHGTQWPECGELDIMETVDGVLTGYGTAHCGPTTGGPCDSPAGNAGSVAISDAGWHTWTLRIDRTDAATGWEQEFIEWQLDGETFHTLTGAAVGDQTIWASLAQSPLFIILNLAVGGDWPGAPNSGTLDGYGSMMEVEYVAVHSNAA